VIGVFINSFPHCIIQTNIQAPCILGMNQMINPIQARLFKTEGGGRPVIIEPVLQKGSGHKWSATGVYRIYKDAFGDETVLFTEWKEDTQKAALPDEQNPDYLGKLIFERDGWKYEGALLSENEQQEAASLIKDHNEPGIDS